MMYSSPFYHSCVMQGPVACAPNTGSAQFSRLALLSSNCRSHEREAPKPGVAAAVTVGEGDDGVVALVHILADDPQPCFVAHRRVSAAATGAIMLHMELQLALCQMPHAGDDDLTASTAQAPSAAFACLHCASSRRTHADRPACATVRHTVETVVASPEPAPPPHAELILRTAPGSASQPAADTIDGEADTHAVVYLAPCSASHPDALAFAAGAFWRVSVPALAQLAAALARGGAAPEPERLDECSCAPVPAPQLAQATVRSVTCFDAALAGPTIAATCADGSGALVPLAAEGAHKAAGIAEELLTPHARSAAATARDARGTLSSIYNQHATCVDKAKLVAAAKSAAEPLSALESAIAELGDAYLSHCSVLYNGLFHTFQNVAASLEQHPAAPDAELQGRIQKLHDGNEQLRKRLTRAVLVRSGGMCIVGCCRLEV
jgi:hypothetical protein